jgi:hypothetical protein
MLYACYIPIGARQLKAKPRRAARHGDDGVQARVRLAEQQWPLERLIFLSGLAVEAEVYRTIAKQLEVQAQMGDCMAAVEIRDPDRLGLDRRNTTVSWALAFGLSLSMN